MAEQEIWIFYSSRTEPDLLDLYSDGITHLKQSDINVELVDITEDKKIAQEHGITATPTLLMKHGDETNKHFGIVSGLRQILQEDLYRRSIIHKLGFKEGRNAVKGLDPDDNVQEQLEDVITSLPDYAFTAVDIDVYRPAENTAKVTLQIDSDDAQIKADELRPFLGGMFTEMFGTGTIAVISEADKDNDQYQFTAKQPKDKRKQELGDLLKEITDES